MYSYSRYALPYLAWPSAVFVLFMIHIASTTLSNSSVVSFETPLRTRLARSGEGAGSWHAEGQCIAGSSEASEHITFPVYHELA